VRHSFPDVEVEPNIESFEAMFGSPVTA
jgi:hypothetical protein